jgi:hypothetical protein
MSIYNELVKPINFKILTRLLQSEHIIDENYYHSGLPFGTTFCRVVRVKDGTIKTRTHNIELTDERLWYEGNSSIEYVHIFNSKEEAKEWWNSVCKIKTIEL